MNIRKLLLNRQIRDDAIKLRFKLLNTIDDALLWIHSAETGKSNIPIDLKGKTNIEIYKRLIVLRKEINIPIEDFINIDSNKIIEDAPIEIDTFKNTIKNIFKGIQREII